MKGNKAQSCNNITIQYDLKVFTSNIYINVFYFLANYFNPFVLPIVVQLAITINIVIILVNILLLLSMLFLLDQSQPLFHYVSQSFV